MPPPDLDRSRLRAATMRSYPRSLSFFGVSVVRLAAHMLARPCAVNLAGVRWLTVGVNERHAALTQVPGGEVKML